MHWSLLLSRFRSVIVTCAEVQWNAFFCVLSDQSRYTIHRYISSNSSTIEQRGRYRVQNRTSQHYSTSAPWTKSNARSGVEEDVWTLCSRYIFRSSDASTVPLNRKATHLFNVLLVQLRLFHKGHRVELPTELMETWIYASDGMPDAGQISSMCE